MTEQPQPPLPKLAMDKNPPPSVVSNNWQTLVKTVPIFSEVMGFVPNEKKVTKIRSPLRTGEMHFDESGIVIEGMAVKQSPRWLESVKYTLLCLIVFAYIARAVWVILNPTFLMRLISLGGILILPVCLVTILLYWEHQRIETRQFLSWESLHSIRVNTERKYIIFVYTSVLVPRPQETLRECLMLTKLDPNLFQGIITTIQHYAPNILQVDTDKKQMFIAILKFYGFLMIAAMVFEFLKIYIRHLMQVP